jgi:predicted hydrocarbon binding protein
LNRTTSRIPTYFYSPRKKMFQLVVKLMDTPGSLAAVLNLLGGRVNLTNTSTHSLTDGTAILTAFAEAISPSETPQKLTKLIAGAHVALEYTVAESSDGLLLNTYHSGVESSVGTPMVVFSQDGISHMFDGLVKVFGTGGEALLYSEGQLVGEADAIGTMSLVGAGLARKRVADLMYMFSARGWGQASLAGKVEGGALSVTLENCFECSTGEGLKKGCGFVRGYFDGWSKVILGREVKSQEVRCRFNGDDHCEFALEEPK